MKCLPSLVVLGAMMGWLVSFAAMAQSDGLVAYWPLDELRAGATPDVVGDYDLKATHLDVSDVVAGRHGRAIAFESGRQTLLSRVHEVGEELPINQHPSFTLSLWVKVDGRRQNDLRLFSEGNTVDSNPLFNLGTHSGGADGRLDVYLRQSGWPTFGHSYSEYEPLDGQWHHLAWVEHDGQRSLYVDGRLDALEIAPRPDGAWRLDNTTLGGILRASPSHWVTGLIDDVAVWRRALSGDEIHQLSEQSVGDWLENGDASLSGSQVKLSRYWVQRSHEVGSVVADLSLSSEEALGPVSFELVEGQGSEGNTSFAVEDQKLMLVSSLERLSHGQELNIRMRVQDAGGWTDEVSMTILVISGEGLIAPVLITELMADNQGIHLDGDGRAVDWIELHNPLSIPVSLAGYFLTDQIDDLRKWMFPPCEMEPGAYLVLYGGAPEVDGVRQEDFRDAQGFLHFSFNLDADGEYLALVEPDGQRIAFELTENYPAQFADVSYGMNAQGKWSFQTRPTPGRGNSAGVLGWVGDTVFSVDRGFYEEPFEVAISTSSGQEAIIHYTLDGSEPSPDHGLVYESPITVSTTTTLRAMAFREGWESTNVDTHTYVFVDDVAHQPAQPSGWPQNWGRNSEVDGRDGAGNGIVPADYEMDPRVVDQTLEGFGIRDALLDIPSVSIVMHPDDFIKPGRGIYSIPQSRIERVCSMEYLHPDGTKGFQENAKIEVHGNSSRRPWRKQKHSLRITFRGQVGVKSLDYPLFENSPVSRFNQLVLRACFTDSWALVSWGSSRYRPNDSQYIRDVWMKESLRDMGQPSSHGSFVHLYVNGLYFGLHNLTERLAEDFFADHLGGDPEDWEINEDFGSPGPRWNQILSMDVTDPDVYEELHQYVDLANLADYSLLHFYADAEDWPHHNGYAAVNPVSGDGRYRFFVWDQEIVLDKFTWNPFNKNSGMGALFQKLRANTDFRRLFADRVQRHLFHGGALSLEASRSRYMNLAQQIDKAIVAESARWGDTQMSTPYGSVIEQPRPLSDVDDDHYPPAPHAPDVYFTREDSWLVERDNVVEHYLPTLHDASSPHAVINELRAANLYPSLDAPSLSLKPGPVISGQALGMQATRGSVYYTLTGQDPWQPSKDAQQVLLPDGASAHAWIPVDDRHGLSWTRKNFRVDDTWLEGRTGVGYETSISDYKGFIGLDVMGMRNFNGSVYIRVPFEMSDLTWMSDDTRVFLHMRYDDGFVAYLNGREVARANAPLGQPSWDSLARASHADSAASQFEAFDITDHQGAWVQGENVLAIHGLNVSLSSSDLLITPKIVASQRVQGALPAEVLTYTQPIPLTQSAHLKARAFYQGEWSALTEAHYSMGRPPAPGDLALTEIHYHPTEPQQGEFVEILNMAQDTLVLDGVTLSDGLSFVFPPQSLLEPGQRVVVAQDPQSLRAAYPGILVYGPFVNHTQLSNGGERLSLLNASGDLLLGLKYGDEAPWPDSADGKGYSLVLRDPAAPGALNDPALWTASHALGGSPGVMDVNETRSTVSSDVDADGIPALGEAFHGTSDAEPQKVEEVFVIRSVIQSNPEPSIAWVMDVLHDPGATEILMDIEVSVDLKTWQSAGISLEKTSEVMADEGRVWLRHTLPPMQTLPSRQFFRLKYFHPR